MPYHIIMAAPDKMINKTVNSRTLSDNTTTFVYTVDFNTNNFLPPPLQTLRNINKKENHV